MTATFPLPANLRRTRWPLCVLLLLTVAHARAQMQEARMDEILHADRNQTSSFAGKTFASSATVGGKQAQTRAFAFSKSAVLRGGDGSFQTRSFADKAQFSTGSFATKTDRATGRDAFALKDQDFATKSMSVREAPAAGKSAFGVREYLPADKSIVIRGKRQGDLDDLYHQKSLSIDQVREILNKPGRGTDAPVQKIGPTPVLPAQPVLAPAAR